MQPWTRAALIGLGLALAAGSIAAPDKPSGLEERLAHAELLAGLTTVDGPGLLVILRHSPRKLRGVDRESLLIRERDVNAILNALRSAGAEALAISGSASEPARLLVSTAITDGPAGLMVGGRTLLPPFRIMAIGDAGALRSELFRADGVVKKAGLEELKMIEVQDAQDLALPAAQSGPGFRYARTDGAIAGIKRRAAGVTPTVPQIPVRQTPIAPPEAGTSAADASPSSTAPGSPVFGPSIPAPASHPGAGSATVGSAAAPPRAAPKVAASTGNEPAKRPAVPAAGASQFFGGKGLAKFHQAGCRFGERIPQAERVFYKSRQEAERSGRTACPFCAVPTEEPTRQAKGLASGVVSGEW